jgi:hypothetical protein
MEDIYKLISTERITFMKDIDNNVEIKGIERFKYVDIWDFNIQMIREFIYNLKDETILLMEITMLKSC